MRASVFVPAFALAAFAQEQSSQAVSAPSVPSFTGDAFPQTSFLKLTNSLGVVTGQPSVETNIPNQPAPVVSQPPAVTDIGIPASIPALAPGVHTVPIGDGRNGTRTLVVSVNPGNNSTSIIGDSATSGSSNKPTGSMATTTTGGAGPSGSGASGASTGSGPQDTNAANVRAAAGGLLGAGMFVAAFL